MERINNRVSEHRIVEFEADIFKGKVVADFSAWEETPEQFFIEHSKYAISRFRLSQGEFKERIRMDQLVTGGEFKRPFQNIPRAIVYTGQELFKVILPD